MRFRRRTRPALAAGIVALLAAAAPPAAGAQADGLAIGARPDPVRLEDLDGRPVDLGAFIGREPVLLEFWATWCANCLALHPRMLEAHRRYGERVRFFAVAVGVGQTPATVRRHLERQPLPFPTLWDGDGEAVRAFEAPATSYIVALDREGRVAYTGVGSDQDVVAAARAAIAEEPETGPAPTAGE